MRRSVTPLGGLGDARWVRVTGVDVNHVSPELSRSPVDGVFGGVAGRVAGEASTSLMLTGLLGGVVLIERGVQSELVTGDDAEDEELLLAPSAAWVRSGVRVGSVGVRRGGG